MAALAALALVAVPAPAPQRGNGPAIRGFPPAVWSVRRALEEKFRDIPEASRVRAYIERMSEEPHAAGSQASKAVAEYAAALMKQWGLEVRIEQFEAMLPYPTTRSVEMVTPVQYRARLEEAAITDDKDSADVNQLPTYNAYSASGDVTGELVYVNYGLPHDYDLLQKQGVDVKGKIVLARYGRSWRGTKPKVAAERGAIGCILYSDPREDGYFQGDVYPKGKFRPALGAQRGSVMDMPLYVGDPLSPGWASETGSRRLPREEAETVMKIPVLPISYEDARPLLENLYGPVAPEPWRGGLPLTYHLGPGPAKVRIKLEFDWTTKPLYNVIARLPGAIHPDEWVIYGNHHDAWVNGATDPASGAAALLETARALAELRSGGWRPRRTIVLALWDGEEFGLVGSTEWMEKYRDELARKVAVYINSDSNTKGPFSASGAHTLEQFLEQVIRDVRDPSGKTVLETLRERRKEGMKQRAREDGFRLGPLGAGSDYVAFFHHGGISSLNFAFSGGFGGVYHSIYDSFRWYSRFGDPDFTYGRALAQVAGTAILRLADAPVLPFEYERFVDTLGRYVAELEKQTGKQPRGIDFAALRKELSGIRESAKALSAALDSVSDWTLAGLVSVNTALIQAERSLLLEKGLPRRPWYRHPLYAPGLYTGYDAKTLPGVRDALEARKYDEAAQQAHEVARALARFSDALRKAAAIARSTRG
jgi:N-acetylated-alpha-linked acidic dipeptidase